MRLLKSWLQKSLFPSFAPTVRDFRDARRCSGLIFATSFPTTFPSVSDRPGTGKTYLAVAAAVSAFEKGEVERIVLTRPAVEAGEKLGFLPGDLSQKVDPYLRPLYDALFDLLGTEKTQRLLEKQKIEIAPLAYMRGRTLNASFVILDEAQIQLRNR